MAIDRTNHIHHDKSWYIMIYHGILSYKGKHHFVAKACNYGIFVAKIYDYAFFDSFWGSAGFFDSPTGYATLPFSAYDTYLINQTTYDFINTYDSFYIPALLSWPGNTVIKSKCCYQIQVHSRKTLPVTIIYIFRFSWNNFKIQQLILQ